MLGTLYVETDWDFSIEHNGELFTDSSFTIEIDSIEELEQLKIKGAFGADRGGKYWEIEEALKAIKQNPSKIFFNTGGNRGARWIPNDIKTPKNTQNDKLEPYLDDVRESYSNNYNNYSSAEIDEKINQLSLKEFLNKYLEYNGVFGYTQDIMNIIKAFQSKQ